MQADFNDASGARKEAARSLSGPAERTDPKSRAELERLKDARVNPMPALTPQSARENTPASAGEIQRREDRIREIKARLDAVCGMASRDFLLGQKRGRARFDFERSR